ncbi:MAG: HAD-IB family phosphatase [Gemmatimonadetes bacterium]|nr:HAD-IB family phosphatase [Gemmatimonadota bacterium]
MPETGSPLDPARVGAVAPRSVVFDVDSTLAGIEGIDWIAARRPAAVAERIAALTEAAMAGERTLEEVYGPRLAAVAPTRAEIDELGRAYLAAIAPGALHCVAALRAAGCRSVIVSGGLRPALLPLAAALGIPSADVHGVGITFGPAGEYLDFDRQSPLAQQVGKATLVAGLALPHPLVAVGDGSTDLVIRTAGTADGFIAFTGFARRGAVVHGADQVVDSFDALTALLLPSP